MTSAHLSQPPLPCGVAGRCGRILHKPFLIAKIIPSYTPVPDSYVALKHAEGAHKVSVHSAPAPVLACCKLHGGGTCRYHHESLTLFFLQGHAVRFQGQRADGRSGQIRGGEGPYRECQRHDLRPGEGLVQGDSLACSFRLHMGRPVADPHTVLQRWLLADHALPHIPGAPHTRRPQPHLDPALTLSCAAPLV